MPRYARPQKQFDFIGNNFRTLDSQSKALLRRSQVLGTTFNDDTDSQSVEVSNTLQSAPDDATAQSQADEVARIELIEIQNTTIPVEELDGFEITAPTNLTIEMDGMDLISFKITDDFHFKFYSNTSNFIDVTGTIERE